ncbi:MAG TPA: hypothetical protein VMK42_20415 [Anaeromyxobacteraceae bacterium]|nr:hypothetical protein [Anaeromyxobacteraceae bacterium]
MPVSKKRKKDGKPVHRAAPAPAAAKEETHIGGEKPFVPQARSGKPSNPFVAMQQAKRGSQRGR